MSKARLVRALHTLFEQGRDPMFIADKRGKITHVNLAFTTLFEYKGEEIIGDTMGVFLRNSLQDILFYKKILRQLLEIGNWSGELHITSRNGEIIPVWTQIIRVDEGFSATQVDMRERDKMTRKMEGLSRLQSVATLAGGVAHEFNNILAGVQGHLYLLKRGLDQPDREKERFTRIDGLMHRATLLVQNLLAFSKQKETVAREVKIATLINETINMAGKSIDAKINLSLKEKDSGLVVFADPVVLKQHLFELISNASSAILNKRKQDAYDYTVIESIDIQVSKVEEGMCEILIRDNGAGMQDATLRHCCDPFFTTKAVGQGTGLGLSSAMAYAQLLRGSFEVESVLGEYTAIRFYLPMAREGAEQSAQHGFVLVVDDDDNLRYLMEEVLNYHGYKVITASDGLEALDLWREHADYLDAVVMDIIMPNMDGIEVAREIRKKNKQVPICLTTGYSHQKIPKNLHVNLLRKPFDPELLLEYINHSIK